MKNQRYLCYEMNQTTEDNNTYTTYGIKLDSTDFTEVLEIEDVSTDRELVARITEMLNKYQASPLHAASIIEDLLVQYV